MAEIHMLAEDVVFVAEIVLVHDELAAGEACVVVGLLPADGVDILVVQRVDAPLVVAEHGVLGMHDAARGVPVTGPP